MHRALLCLTTALCLTLTSCASRPTLPAAYVPPRIDCAAFDPPLVQPPLQPSSSERHPVPWQLYAWNWQAYAEHVLTQRVETAACLHRLKQQGVIR